MALTAYASAFWIMVANAWLQHPVGYEVRDGIAHLTDFGALLTNPSLGMAFGHVVSAALLAGRHADGGRQRLAPAPAHPRLRAASAPSLRIGLVTASLAISLVQGFGFAQFGPVGEVQPTKFGGTARTGAGADRRVDHPVRSRATTRRRCCPASGWAS